MPKLGNFVDDAKGVASLSSQPSSLENKDYVRFVCISDTHNDHKRIKVPDGDVLLHAGDFTKFGTEKEIFEFNRWLGTLPHRHKIVVSGNHDLTMDTGFYDREWRKWHDEKQDSVKAKALLTNCRYLENEGIEIDGVRVFATPNMPKDSGRLWAWNRSSHHLSEFWGRLALSVDTIYHRRFWADNLLKYELHLHINCLRSSNSRRMLSPFFGHFSSFPPPSLLPLPLSLMTTEKKLVPQMGKVDVLLTHSPPRGVLDRCWSGHRVGSRPLLAGLRRLKPKFCVFGHIHEDYGVKVEEVSGTVCINAASCTMLGAARHEPIVFDISKSTKAAT
mmetsp:Transcript_38230/g.62143  ORF Transcript_38230/g.62143 Transcript_38230/m.62143 type:complete len:332 (+) Transcript_38230:469-1464(+)